MDLNENYLLRKKSEYVVHLLKKSGYSFKLLGGRRGVSDVFESLLSNSEFYELEEQFGNLQQVDQKGKRELRLKLIMKIEYRIKKMKKILKSDYEKNLDVITDLLNLTSGETRLLECFLINLIQSDLEDFTDNLGSLTLHKAISVWSVMTKISTNEIRKSLSAKSNFLNSGLVELENETSGNNNLERIYKLSETLITAFTSPYREKQNVWQHFFKSVPATKLDSSCFEHLHEELELLECLLKSTIEHGQKGVNILFYGVAGAGKTELVRLMAKQTGLDLYEVTPSNDQGEFANIRERIAYLATSLRALQSSSGSLLLFDEADEILNGENTLGGLSFFQHDRNGTVYKPWLNRLLETNSTPVFWIVNQFDGIDPAIQRRFSYSLCFKPPGRTTRMKMWEQVLRKKQVMRQIDSEALKSLAQDYEITVGVMEKAVETAKLMSRKSLLTPKNIRTALDKSFELLKGRKPEKKSFPSKKYQESFDLSLLNTTPLHESLIRALDHFTKTPEKERLLPCVSVCLHGPPGTGKSALARHLANELERPLFVKRASDLLSMFVGGTEANLSEAFSEATEENGIMLIDEVDTFLLDRSGASRSWEVTQVNEFLTQLEQFRGIFFATTNRLESLDEAVLRRFTFKLKFNYLSQKQREKAFHCHFDALLKSSGKNEAKLESVLSGLQHLTPGDFEVVRRKIQFQIEAPTQFSLLEELEAEMRLKPVCKKRKVGF